MTTPPARHVRGALRDQLMHAAFSGADSPSSARSSRGRRRSTSRTPRTPTWWNWSFPAWSRTRSPWKSLRASSMSTVRSSRGSTPGRSVGTRAVSDSSTTARLCRRPPASSTSVRIWPTESSRCVTRKPSRGRRSASRSPAG
jgi:hypothetical protein